MYLHLGQDTVITFEEIIGIFDLDNSTVTKTGRDYINKAQRDDKIINISEDLPKAFVLCNNGKDEKIYLSQLSTGTLLKRAEKTNGGFNFG